MSARDAFDDWIAEARGVSVAEFCRARAIALRPADQGQPCPGCGGRDRFSVNAKKNLWQCRVSGLGGDAIALAQHMDGSDFLAACEAVTGRPPPGREVAESEAQRRARETRLAQEAERRAREAAEKERAAARFREEERRQAFRIWRAALPAAGTPVEAYLALRGLAPPPQGRLRFAADLPLWDRPGGRILHRGPAMVAAIERPDGRFGGVHRTWLDLRKPKGKAEIVDPATGEALPAKKVRGSKKGGSILLAHSGAAPRRFFLGEGVETVLSAYWSLREACSALLDGAEFRSAVDLDNLAGKAKGRVRHPEAATRDAAGRMRPVFVRSDEPDLDDDRPIIFIPGSVEELVLLGDGDSDEFATRLAMRRAVARFSARYPQLTIRLAMSAPGLDFNDMRLRGRRAA